MCSKIAWRVLVPPVHSFPIARFMRVVLAASLARQLLQDCMRTGTLVCNQSVAAHSGLLLAER